MCRKRERTVPSGFRTCLVLNKKSCVGACSALGCVWLCLLWFCFPEESICWETFGKAKQLCWRFSCVCWKTTAADARRHSLKNDFTLPASRSGFFLFLWPLYCLPFAWRFSCWVEQNKKIQTYRLLTGCPESLKLFPSALRIVSQAVYKNLSHVYEFIFEFGVSTH